ncbi:MAG: carbohydrate porin [Aliidongia sp.]
MTDIFDTNSYAHDPRADFLNWAVNDAGAFDYAADAWGFTYGAAAEWTQDWWTLRAGIFDRSRVPNSRFLNRGFGEFSTVAEFEMRSDWLGAPSKIKLLAFEDTGDIANYNDAVRAAAGTAAPPNVAAVRKYSTKPGAAINAEQQILPDLGAFLRASLDDGHKEAYEFTEINRSVSAGLSAERHTLGSAGRHGRPRRIVSGISSDARKLSRRRRSRHPDRRRPIARILVGKSAGAVLQCRGRRGHQLQCRLPAGRKSGLRRLARSSQYVGFRVHGEF